MPLWARQERYLASKSCPANCGVASVASGCAASTHQILVSANRPGLRVTKMQHNLLHSPCLQDVFLSSWAPQHRPDLRAKCSCLYPQAQTDPPQPHTLQPDFEVHGGCFSLLCLGIVIADQGMRVGMGLRMGAGVQVVMRLACGCKHESVWQGCEYESPKSQFQAEA